MAENAKCPFCGRDQSYFHAERINSQRCAYCGARGPIAKTEQEAIDAWNHRPLESALLQRAEKAEAALEEAIEAMESAENWLADVGKMRLPEMTETMAKIREVLNETNMP